MVTLSLMAFFITASPEVNPVERPVLNEVETKRLEAGETVIQAATPTGNRGIALKSMGVIDAASSEVWPVLRDCQHFSRFMPKTKTSSLIVENEVPLCHVELRLPFPLPNLWSDTRSVQREEPAGHYHRAWTLVRGTYRRNSGSWTILPWGEASKKTLVVYAIDSDPSILVPDALIHAAQAESIPEVFSAIRKRVVALRNTP